MSAPAPFLPASGFPLHLAIGSQLSESYRSTADQARRPRRMRRGIFRREKVPMLAHEMREIPDAVARAVRSDQAILFRGVIALIRLRDGRCSEPVNDGAGDLDLSQMPGARGLAARGRAVSVFAAPIERTASPTRLVLAAMRARAGARGAFRHLFFRGRLRRRDDQVERLLHFAAQNPQLIRGRHHARGTHRALALDPQSRQRLGANPKARLALIPSTDRDHGLASGGLRFLPLGQPPFRAFFRAALALASEVARPPRRPSAWAALFTGRQQGFRLIDSEILGMAVRGGSLEESGSRISKRLDALAAYFAFGPITSGKDGKVSVDLLFEFGELLRVHGSNNTEPLGYCNRESENLQRA
jgi:hypothetical protein